MGFLSKAFKKKQNSSCCNIKIEELKPNEEQEVNKQPISPIKESCCKK